MCNSDPTAAGKRKISDENPKEILRSYLSQNDSTGIIFSPNMSFSRRDAFGIMSEAKAYSNECRGRISDENSIKILYHRGPDPDSSGGHSYLVHLKDLFEGMTVQE